ncbi:MAG: hypothetical protein ABW005_13255 [Burkholderiaceae bacterium]
MAFSFTESQEQLRYEEQGNDALPRAIFAVIGLAAVASSYLFIELIATMGQANTPRIANLLASVLALVAFGLFGAYCLKLAIPVPRQALIFDKVRKQLIDRARMPVLGTRERAYGFEAISSIQLIRRPAEAGDAGSAFGVGADGPAWFTVKLALACGESLLMGDFEDPQEATRHLQQICRAVGQAPQPVAPPGSA